MSSGKAAGGGLIAVLAMGVAHGADDCARAGARAGRTLGDDALRGSRAVGELGAGSRLAAHADEVALGSKMNWGPAPRLGASAEGVGDDVIDAARLRTTTTQVEGGHLAEFAPDGADLVVEGVSLYDSEDDRPRLAAVALAEAIDAPVLVVQPQSRPEIDAAIDEAGKGSTLGIVGVTSGRSGEMLLSSGERLNLVDVHRDCSAYGLRCIAISCEVRARGCVDGVAAAWDVASQAVGTQAFMKTLYADLVGVEGWVLSRPLASDDGRTLAVFVAGR